MHDDDARLLRLVRDIADGVHVDWDETATMAAETGEEAFFAALRDVAHLVWFHRAQQLAAGVAPDASAPSELGRRKPAPASPPGRASGDGGRASAPRPGGGVASADGVISRWTHLELRQKLGEGVFGEVFLAWDPKLEREVALKLMRGGSWSGAMSGSLAPHLLQEARHLARIRHANVVTVYGAEFAEGKVGLWMEYIRGETLEQVLGVRGPFGAREAALVGVDLCRALTAVHRAGLVHRDVKAKNAMREEGGRIVLMDFGAGIESVAHGQSMPGAPAGTPVYLAPEIFQGRRASPQSDLYSLGVLLYHLVSGSFPAEGETLRDIALVHERGAARVLREERPDLPDAFLRAVEKTLARDPQDRYTSAGQLEHALAAALT